MTLSELKKLYEAATKGPYELYSTAMPCHYEIGPSLKNIVAMMTNDGTEENEFGFNNACFLRALVNSFPALVAIIEAADDVDTDWNPESAKSLRAALSALEGGRGRE